MKTRVIYSDDPARGWLPWGVVAPLLAFVFVVAPWLMMSSVLERSGLMDARGEPIGQAGLAAFLLLPFALIGAIVLGWVLGVERRPLRSIGLAPGGAGRFLRGLLIGMVTLAAVVAAIWLAGGLQAGGYARALGSPTALGSIAVLLACFALQSGVEEIVFRGWLLSVVSRKLNVPVAVLVTSMLFSALHIGPAQPWLVTLNKKTGGPTSSRWLTPAILYKCGPRHWGLWQDCTRWNPQINGVPSAKVLFGEQIPNLYRTIGSGLNMLADVVAQGKDDPGTR